MRPLFDKDEQYKRVYQWLFFVIATAGAALRIYQHFSGRPLWEDEAHLALNFIYFGYKDLTIPLSHFQVAPILFLFSIETITRIFGFSEEVLRSFPFIISLLVYPLFYHVAYYITNSRLAAIISFAILSFSVTIIHYSSELKPYIIELSAYVGLIYLLISKHRYVKKYRYTLLAVGGSLAMLLANASHIVLVCITTYMILSLIKNDESFNRKKSFYVFVVWLVVFSLNFFTFIYHHPYSEPMRQLWAARFLPMPFSDNFGWFIKMVIDETFFDAMLLFTRNWYFPYILAALYVIALVYVIAKKSSKVIVFVLLPIIIHLSLSVVKVYPLYTRFYIYLMPALIITLSIGVVYLVQLLNKKILFALAVMPALFVLVCTVVVPFQHFSDVGRNIKPGIDFINKKPTNMKLFVTTPATLYEYYSRLGVAKNTNVEEIAWSLSPAQYYDSVAHVKSGYLLLCSEGGYADGYAEVIKDVKNEGLVVEQFTYGTYTVLQLNPIQ